jgi:hypothetical protein
MHRRYRHRGFGGCGPGSRGRPYPSREEWLRSLEEYQKDLEQEVADVADLIRRLEEEEKAGETATV